MTLVHPKEKKAVHAQFTAKKNNKNLRLNDYQHHTISPMAVAAQDEKSHSLFIDFMITLTRLGQQH